jgi:hypothetical protein
METTKFVYFQEDDLWIGWLEEYPDYRSQGVSLEELKENLKDIYSDLTTGKVPYARRVGELAVG